MHNLGVASLLSFVAGIVNVVGFLSIQKLTTNVTGHFAFMVEEALKINFAQSIFYFLYISRQSSSPLSRDLIRSSAVARFVASGIICVSHKRKILCASGSCFFS